MSHQKIGTLLFVDSSRSPIVGDLCHLPGCIDSLGILKEQRERGEADVFTVKSGTQITYQHLVLEPVVVSYTEKIGVGDKILCDDRDGERDMLNHTIQTVDRIVDDWWIYTKEKKEPYNPDCASKIIAVPSFFSKDTLLEIVNGKLKENGVVIVDFPTLVIKRATNKKLWDLIKKQLYVGDSEDDKSIDWVIDMLKAEYLPPKPKKKK